MFQAVKHILDMTAEKIVLRGEQPVRFIMTGGAAMALYSPTRSSNDIEGIFSHRLDLPDVVISYKDEDGRVRSLAWDKNYSPTLGLLHPGYDNDPVFVTDSEDQKIRIMVLHPLDLAVTKVARYADNDQRDIQELFTSGLITPHHLESRAVEAMEYFVGNIPEVVSKLDTALEKMGHTRTMMVPTQKTELQPLKPLFTDAQRLRHGSEFPVKILSAGQVTCKLQGMSVDETVAFAVLGGQVHAVCRGNGAPMPELRPYKDCLVTLSESMGELNIRVRDQEKGISPKTSPLSGVTADDAIYQQISQSNGKLDMFAARMESFNNQPEIKAARENAAKFGMEPHAAIHQAMDQNPALKEQFLHLHKMFHAHIQPAVEKHAEQIGQLKDPQQQADAVHSLQTRTNRITDAQKDWPDRNKVVMTENAASNPDNIGPEGQNTSSMGMVLAPIMQKLRDDLFNESPKTNATENDSAQNTGSAAFNKKKTTRCSRQ